MKADNYAIALTGGIATGKSSAGKIFLDYGFEIIDADRIAHQVLNLQAERIAKLFGSEYLSEGKVDRQALGRLVFGEEKQRKILEGLLHPLIREEIMQQVKQLDTTGKPYLVDIPLFFESGLYPFSEVIVVYSPRKRQLARLLERNGYTVEEAESRLAAQMDIEEKRNKATYVIDNSGDRDQLKRECLRVSNLIWKKIGYNDKKVRRSHAGNQI